MNLTYLQAFNYSFYTVSPEVKMLSGKYNGGNRDTDHQLLALTHKNSPGQFSQWLRVLALQPKG